MNTSKQQVKKEHIEQVLELMLEMWNEIYLHRGDVGIQTHKEIADKIVKLYEELKHL